MCNAAFGSNFRYILQSTFCSSTRFWRQSWSKRTREGLQKLLLRPGPIEETHGLLQCQEESPRRCSALVSFGARIPRAKVHILLSELSTLFEASGVGRDLQVGWPWLLTHPVTSCPFFSNGKHPQGSEMPPWGPTFVTFSGTLFAALLHGFGDRAGAKGPEKGFRSSC